MIRWIVFFTLLVTSAFGANKYIRTGAAGTGSGDDWTNAYASFGAVTYSRSNTYYVAGGTYNESVTVNVALSGTTILTIKKATVADHGTDTGWSDSYGTTAATITGRVSLERGYVTWNGVTGSGTSGHGFVVYSSSTSAGKVFSCDAATPNYVVCYTEIKGPGAAASDQAIAGLNYNNVAGSQKNAYFHHLWIHDVTTNGVEFLGLVGTSFSDYGFLFENNWITETGLCTNVDNHGQGMQLGQATPMAYGVIRNNVFRNVSGSGFIAYLTSGNGAAHSYQAIYNNTFYLSDLVNYTIVSPGVVWHEQVHSYTGCSNTNMTIANNVFYNVTSGSNLGQIVLEMTDVTDVANNNVWEKCQFTSNHTGITQTTNGYQTSGTGTNTGAGLAAVSSGQVTGSATTFTSAPTGDFTLASLGYGVGAGTSQAALFTTYADGTTRTGTWSLGPLPVSGSTPGGSGLSGAVTLSGNLILK